MTPPPKPCGCRITCGCAAHTKQRIVYCPLHAAALELVEALKRIVTIRNNPHPANAIGKATEMWKVAEQAISRAEGRKDPR